MIRPLLFLLLAFQLAACSTAAPPSPVPDKLIALSFDDVPRTRGPWLDHDVRTRRLIASLDNAGVDEAVFFLNPGGIAMAGKEGAEDRIDAYVAAGHLIANHTQTHRRLSATDLNAWLADVDAAEAYLEGRKGYRPWLRYPYLDEGARDAAKRDASRRAIHERGLRKAWVSVDGYDWLFERVAGEHERDGRPYDRAALAELYIEHHLSAANFADALARRLHGRAVPHMMLLHETDLAALHVDDLVTALRTDGWTIVSPDRVYADPAYGAWPLTDWAGGTLFEQLAWQQELPEPIWFDGNKEDALRATIEARIAR
ncbi:polysaccharide deacetylase family protein [Sphingomicrobium aestuariivivum]|uniref:polysaccharide deacetylase family protein n=1 Tax=Sphingomicrobium aestuariivivum TaxID=1582356 RepID=UPI001FD6EF71|nr:polysaccharide deacetylase family protein [Sphingomicrobium aestuariivivum]MCJ8191702.1 polysaccharide deacetylase family protein [Sphingomicrobium aestuariivivum]